MLKGIAKVLILQGALLIVTAFLLSGCGRKAPPVPPLQAAPPTVGDLSAGRDGDTIALTWTIPKHKGEIPRSLKGFIVYRAKQLLSEDKCPNCPILFKRIAAIGIEVESEAKRSAQTVMTYRDAPEKGYQYIYKVVVELKTGITGGDSNWAKVTLR
ncbi:MAG: hypothetical protein KKH68_13735 [Proteobacteria bacterium]|nr:hypothetical protein [Pseudomonadota bacterium]